MSSPLLSGMANILADTRNVAAKEAVLLTTIGLVGNWVGGRFSCDATALSFTTNAMNRRLQTKDADATIPYCSITDLQFGRMMIWARTVDITTDAGFFRLRTAPRHTQSLFDLLDAHRP